MKQLAFGIYEALIDESIREALASRPELRSVFGKIDPEELPGLYASFVAKVLEQALREERNPEKRFELCNRILAQVAGEPGMSHLAKHRLIKEKKSILLEITPANYASSGLPRPQSSLTESSLFTGSPQEPQLAHELLEEMKSADSVDILVSFVKWSGLRLLMPAFEDLRLREIPVRVITTSYMGASDAPAVEWLAAMPNVKVRLSYDTERTRLHAKAYHFKRKSDYSTAYIGSANMSNAAMTSGLEWNLKVTAQDMGHILEKFTAEFETYWNSKEFIPFDHLQPERFRDAIGRERNKNARVRNVFFDLSPHPFQERILEALQRERELHHRYKNLIIAATGTGKTVVAAFDFHEFFKRWKGQAKLLFVAHRKEILEQALVTFRNVLHDHNFGELLVGNYLPNRREHLFCSVQMLSSRQLWKEVGESFYDYIVVDEVHHGTSDSYRPVFDHFRPTILLGLTATPERMDGKSVAADFHNTFAAEIRLPEALEEKLLCPFHYFGVSDPVATNHDRFWSNGNYSRSALENVYTGDHVNALQRLSAIIGALERYQPDYRKKAKGIGFCVTVNHALYMAKCFNERGISSAAVVSGIASDDRNQAISDFKSGQLKFLFTVDVFNEGLDIPDINLVLFLRPTESLTVFLQQLGRGLRHAPEKECLTVLDFVGQVHQRYRMDTRFRALLPKHRYAIDREVEMDFPHLPPGCSIQLDRQSREYVLKNIRENLKNLQVQVPDRLQTFTSESGLELTFGNFIRYHDYEPEVLLAKESWSGWKAKVQLVPVPLDEDLALLKKALIRAAFINGPKEAALLQRVIAKVMQGAIQEAAELAGQSAMILYYRIWAERGAKLGITSFEESLVRLSKNPSIMSDLDEILSWSIERSEASGQIPDLPFNSPLELHAQYGGRVIQAAFGKATLETTGQTGVGVFHFPEVKAYALLITFQKTAKEFSPSTMYADYPISRELLHWESQANTAQHHQDGLNLIHHVERGYTVLVFARDQKNRNKATVPFTYLGPAELVSYESERPIRMIWRLCHQMPVEMFEENRRTGQT